MKRFENKVVVITGAGSGIGKATVERLSREGALVACLDINETAVKEVAASTDGRAVAFTCDVRSEDSVRSAVDGVVKAFSRIDVLCNVAGILRTDNTHELELSNWQKIIDVNLTGTFLMCRSSIPHLLQTKGVIVNMSSTAALGSHPWMAAYAASKGGVLSLTQALYAEYVKKGIRANAICAGGIATPLHGQFRMPNGVDPSLIQGAMPHVPYVGPEHCASVIAFLASDDARYINGSMIRVDGGALS